MIAIITTSDKRQSIGMDKVKEIVIKDERLYYWYEDRENAQSISIKNIDSIYLREETK